MRHLYDFKLLILVTLIVLLSGFGAFSQAPAHARNAIRVDYPRPFFSSAELHIGPSLVYFRGDPSNEGIRAAKAGYSIQFRLSHEFNPIIHTAIVFGYESKGSKTVVESLNTDFVPPAKQKHISDITLNYFTIGVLGKCAFLRNPRLYFGLGPYAGYLHRVRFQKELFLNGALFSKSSGRPDPWMSNREFDVGGRILVDYKFTVLKKRMASVELTYCHGVVNVNKPSMEVVKNSSIFLLFGIQID